METTSPEWDHCGTGATDEDPVGCRGVRAGGRARCLAHLAAGARAVYLARLAAGADVDCRGVTFDDGLLAAVLAGVTGEDGYPVFGAGRFEQARFAESASFARAEFRGPASFQGARLEGAADFGSVRFRHGAWFKGARFAGSAEFGGAHISDDAGFADTWFGGTAWFGGVRIEGRLWLERARFAGDAVFLRGVFGADWVGPVTCDGTLSLAEAEFRSPLRLALAASRIDARAARCEGPVALSVRYAAIDLTGAVLLHPCRISTDLVTELREPAAARAGGADHTASIVSLRGVDAAMLTVADVDLRGCVFAGTHHLDQLGLEGNWQLGASPQGVRWQWGVPRSWTRRLVLEEERQWRALPGRGATARRGWGAAPENPDTVPGLATLTSVYRQLRKAREDALDQPGAADFYYGEMEMRRHSHTWRRAERWLLQAYWLLAGYGLRASRALVWLACAVAGTVVLMMGLGLPDTEPQQQVRRVQGGGSIRMVMDKAEPQLTLPVGERFTGERFEKSLRVVLNSVLFRSSGQDLTLWGTYTEMVSRLTEPVLLGLAALAVRGRVKRGS
ncbi:pentapeptide repeat-containing protein [Streptomyces sioyaensis]|uniref:pentapeptide repeat-containing protein n=1 Tax=Streptomyces sioyaensis TaxID=67364 RepID=UPI00379B7F61